MKLTPDSTPSVAGSWWVMLKAAVPMVEPVGRKACIVASALSRVTEVSRPPVFADKVVVPVPVISTLPSTVVVE